MCFSYIFVGVGLINGWISLQAQGWEIQKGRVFTVHFILELQTIVVSAFTAACFEVALSFSKFNLMSLEAMFNSNHCML
jgi:hypothetical protein